MSIGARTPRYDAGAQPARPACLLPDEKSAADHALEHALRWMGAHGIGTRRYGWSRKSAGTRVHLRGGEEAWLRVRFVHRGDEGSRHWTGVLAAREIRGVPRPELLGYRTWTEGDRVWQANLMTYVAEPLCSPEPRIVGEHLPLPESWLRELRHALERLARHPTDRTAFPQEMIDRRLRERFGGDFDTRVQRWVTLHDDLHWSNLTHPRLFILDWEAWGRGPLGFDPALLMAFAADHPRTVRQIRRHFGDWLDTPDGRLSQLLACYDVLRIADERESYRALRGPVRDLAGETLRRIRVARG